MTRTEEELFIELGIAFAANICTSTVVRDTVNKTACSKQVILLECSSMEYQGIDRESNLCWFLYASWRIGPENIVPQSVPPGSAVVLSSSLPVLTGMNGAVCIGSREVKFLDRAKTNVSEGILQVYLH